MAEEGGPKIFISHASGDPDWPDLAVEAIADKLRQRGAQVWLDLWHEREVVLHKLPLAEWRQWMGRCLDEADHVLCLCSTRYAMLAHRGDQEEPAGRGVAYESFEIEKRIYKQKQHNKDWVWLLRLEDAPSGAVVPEFLEDRCPEYSTPSEDTRLVNELVGNRLTKGRVERPVGETQAEPCFSAETDALRDQCSLACRAGTETAYYFGEQIHSDQVNYDGNHPPPGGREGEYRQRTVPVKVLPANAWGLYQMHGNVLEWCADGMRTYRAEPAVDPDGGQDSVERVQRGGSWFYSALRARSAYRDYHRRSIGEEDFGFRFALRSIEPSAGGGTQAGAEAGGAR